MRRSILHLDKKRVKKLWLTCLILFLIVLGTVASYFLVFTNKIYPNISIAGVKVGGLSIDNATNLLSSRFNVPEKIQLVGVGKSFNIETKDFEFSYNFPDSSQKAFNFTRTGNFLNDQIKKLDLLIHPRNFELTLNSNNDKLTKAISIISSQVSVDPIDPSISLVDGTITVDIGTAGRGVDEDKLKTNIIESLAYAKSETIEIPINTIDDTLKQNEADELKSRAEKYLGKSLQLKFEYETYTSKDKELIKFIDYRTNFNTQKVESMVDEINKKVNREPQNPKFVFDNGRVSEFQPASDGVRVNNDSLKEKIINSLKQIESSEDKVITLEIPVLRTPAAVTTDSVNNLGIKELLGRGTSTFYHSIPSRVHNVALAASRINGTLVKPGETFSFNTTLGDVSQFTGYKQAYIISEGKTILGDGGGVCQVSTTLFRSVLNAGLPIIERQAHAYRVGYYEQNSPAGFDATVFGPSPDFKFINDTPSYILIEAKADTKNYSLVFELYGTSDGRLATNSKPSITNVVAPPADLYQDDSTLPAGTVKQVEYRASGSRVSFNYSVKRNGEEIYKKIFISNYRPWQAVYLRGTGSAI